jgi:hypothetical protein
MYLPRISRLISFVRSGSNSLLSRTRQSNSVLGRLHLLIHSVIARKLLPNSIESRNNRDTWVCAMAFLGHNWAASLAFGVTAILDNHHLLNRNSIPMMLLCKLYFNNAISEPRQKPSQEPSHRCLGPSCCAQDCASRNHNQK